MSTKKAAASANRRAKAADAENSEKTARLKPYRFKPGQSGNPGGRPKNALSDALRQQLAQVHPKKQVAIVELIAAALIKKAIRGDVKACDIVGNRTEGKPHQQIDVTGQMNVNVVIDL